MSQRLPVRIRVNGEPYERSVEPRLLLSDFLRHELGLSGTNVGCEHGVCGACTVLLDGSAVRSCLCFAVQANDREVVTVEGLAPPGATTVDVPGDRPGGEGDGADGSLHPLQVAFHEAHGLQCGFCTPGLLMTLVPFLEENPRPTRREIRLAISGNLCRCTGYQKIVDAVELAARRLAGEGGSGAGGRSGEAAGRSGEAAAGSGEAAGRSGEAGGRSAEGR